MISSCNALYDYIYDLTGLTFPESNRNTMDERIKKLFGDKGVTGDSLVNLLKSDKESLQKLLDLLTVNESYFFREMEVIDEMVSRIMKRSGKVRILCAPSSSGEESFSIVMTLLKAGKPASEIEIVGIDINSEVIETAQKAIYTKRRVHRVNEADIKRFFP
jgi:chemotaxis protein methyltransferase CheR